MRLNRQELAWSLTEAANEPYFNLVKRYVFAPYFAGTLAMAYGAGEGTAMWAYAIGAAGLAVAVLAPVLGSIADSGARLKPWLAAIALVAMLSSGALWFAAPGVPLLPVALAVFVGVTATELMAQFSNAFLPRVTASTRMGLLSGLAFGLAQLAGIAVLLAILSLVRNPPAVLAGIPNATDRLAGPIAAAAVLLFLVPLLLTAPDDGGTKRPSVGRGLTELRVTLAEAWQERQMRLFLIGRMIAADGMAVVFAFGAVLAGATFGWGADSLAVFGIIITVFGAAGGFLAGWLDGRIGTRALMLAGLGLLSAGTACVLVTDAERLFGLPTGVALGAPLQSPQEMGFLAAGAFIAVGAAFTLASMRTMMALLAPPGKTAAYFGLFSFVGKATAFVGPFLVGVIASQTGSVRAGIGLALAFLLVGLWALALVRSPNSRVAEAR